MSSSLLEMLCYWNAQQEAHRYQMDETGRIKIIWDTDGRLASNNYFEPPSPPPKGGSYHLSVVDVQQKSVRYSGPINLSRTLNTYQCTQDSVTRV